MYNIHYIWLSTSFKSSSAHEFSYHIVTLVFSLRVCWKRSSTASRVNYEKKHLFQEILSNTAFIEFHEILQDGICYIELIYEY